MSPRLRLWAAVWITAAALLLGSWLAPRGRAGAPAGPHATAWAPSWPVPALRGLAPASLGAAVTRAFAPSLPLPMWRPRTAAADAHRAAPLALAEAAALARVSLHAGLALLLGAAAALLPRLRPRRVRRPARAAERVHVLVRRGHDAGEIARRSRLSRDAVRALLASREHEHAGTRG